MIIGVLAMQGAYAKHCEMLDALGVSSIEVKRPEDLKACCGLILPGGESTVMKQQMEEAGLIESVKAFSQAFPCFGTCAGMILMSAMGMLDLTINRNGYGRQIASFSAPLIINLPSPVPLQGVFIRAPRIQNVNSDHVRVLAFYLEEPVCVQQGFHLASAFHPELTNDLNLHRYFVAACKEKQSQRQQ